MNSFAPWLGAHLTLHTPYEPRDRTWGAVVLETVYQGLVPAESCTLAHVLFVRVLCCSSVAFYSDEERPDVCGVHLRLYGGAERSRG